MAVTIRDAQRTFQRLLEENERRTRDVRPARVMGRATDGRTLLLDLSGECIAAEGSGGYGGEIVTQLPSLANRLGTAGVPVVSRRDSAALLTVTALDPALFSRGATALEVTVTGTGFTPTTVFEFLLPASEEVNPDIEIVSSTYVSSTEFTLVVNVAADADIVTAAPLAFDDPARRF